MMKTSRIVQVAAALLLVFLFVGGSSAFGEDIKERMLKRLPEITSLMARGVVGENNKGFLEFRGAQEQAALVQEENSDRQAVYGAIARQQGTTPDLVGARRAQQIADRAVPGEWLQDPAGNWYQK